MLEPKTIAYKAGATIIAQGETKPGFYILKSGAVEVFKNDVMLNVLMFPGTIFGEMSDILEKPRSCTVKARNECELEHYDTVDMRELIQNDPDLALKIFKTLAARLERTTEKLADTSAQSTFWSVEKKRKGPPPIGK